MKHQMASIGRPLYQMSTHLRVISPYLLLSLFYILDKPVGLSTEATTTVDPTNKTASNVTTSSPGSYNSTKEPECTVDPMSHVRTAMLATAVATLVLLLLTSWCLICLYIYYNRLKCEAEDEQPNDQPAADKTQNLMIEDGFRRLTLGASTDANQMVGETDNLPMSPTMGAGQLQLQQRVVRQQQYPQQVVTMMPRTTQAGQKRSYRPLFVANVSSPEVRSPPRSPFSTFSAHMAPPSPKSEISNTVGISPAEEVSVRKIGLDRIEQEEAKRHNDLMLIAGKQKQQPTRSDSKSSQKKSKTKSSNSKRTNVTNSR